MQYLYKFPLENAYNFYNCTLSIFLSINHIYISEQSSSSFKWDQQTKVIKNRNSQA